MLKSILELLGFSGTKIKKTIDKSTEFIDDALEKEYITGTIEKAKEFTGDVVEKAGEVYAKSKERAEDLVEDERFRSIAEQAQVLGQKIEENNDNEIKQNRFLSMTGIPFKPTKVGPATGLLSLFFPVEEDFE